MEVETRKASGHKALLTNQVQDSYSQNVIRRSTEREIDLRELLLIIFRGKWVIVLITSTFALVSFVYAFSLPNMYESEVLLAPTEEGRGGFASLTGQFGGLASLAGVNINGGARSKTTLAMEVLKSRKFISAFVDKHNLILPVIAANGWDSKSNELSYNENLYDSEKNIWLVSSIISRHGSQPGVQEVYEKFMEFFTVTQDGDSKYISISVEFFSPYVAKQWADWIVQDINQDVKFRDVTEARNSIDYLTRQIERTQITEMQAVFYELIEEQTKTIMLAEIRDEYVFKTIDDAVVPERKSGPRRGLILVSATIFGFMFSLFVVFLRHSFKELD